MVDSQRWGPSLRATVAATHAGQPVREVVSAAQQAIEDQEPQLRAWEVLDARAPARADQLDEAGGEGALFGVPVGIKDIIDVAGLPTRCGSPITSPEPVAESAACVQRLEELGAVVMGKTVTTEFAYFKPGPTQNPRAPGHTPGGSSSGSAAAVAAGTIPLALGSQTAGSLVRPASYCGIAGMVLGHDTVDLTGVVGLSPALDALGLLTRDVADLELAYRALTGDDRASAQAGEEVPLLLWPGGSFATLEPAMARVVEILGDLLADWDLQPFEGQDHIETLATDQPILMGYEAARERQAELRDHADQLSRPLFELLDQGSRISDDDYWQASFRRDRSRIDLAPLLTGAVVLGPGALGPAPAGLDATGSPILSRPWQALGFPTVAIPGLRDGDGLPLGLQAIGAPGTEPTLLAVAAAVEARLTAAEPVT